MFGFSKGDLHLTLNKRQFSPGETVEGTVRLELNKAIEATALRVRLYATKRTKTRRTSDSGTKTSSRSEIFYDFTIDLDGEREYLPSETNEYPFQITIPKHLESQGLPDNMLGDLVKVMQFFSQSSIRIEWNVKAFLDIPWSIDISETVDINVA